MYAMVRSQPLCWDELDAWFEESAGSGTEAPKGLAGASIARRVRLARPPATEVVLWLKRYLPRRVYENLVEPVLAEERSGYYEALQQDDDWHARVIAARLYILLFYNVLRAVAAALAGIFKSWK
jgi:hypothetical protein